MIMVSKWYGCCKSRSKSVTNNGVAGMADVVMYAYVKLLYKSVIVSEKWS